MSNRHHLCSQQEEAQASKSKGLWSLVIKASGLDVLISLSQRPSPQVHRMFGFVSIHPHLDQLWSPRSMEHRQMKSFEKWAEDSIGSLGHISQETSLAFKQVSVESSLSRVHILHFLNHRPSLLPSL